MKPHKLRSVFSEELLYPPDWLKEIIELEYDEYEILTIIETYELYLALIIRSLQFLHRRTYLSEWSENILKESDKWVNENISNTQFKDNYNTLYSFIKNFNWGVGIDRDNTKKCYCILNDIIRYCFYPNNKGYKVNIENVIKDYNRQWKVPEKKDNNNFAKGIQIFYFTDYDFLELQHLVEYFIRTKKNITLKLDEKKSKRQLTNQKIEFPSFIINMIMFNTFLYGDPYTKELLANIQENNKEILEILNKFGNDFVPKLNKLLSELKESQYNDDEIKEILNKLSQIDRTTKYKLHYNSPVKLLFLYEFSYFEEILGKLIEKKYIRNLENNDHFIWQYKNIKKTKMNKPSKQEGMIVLAFLFLDFYYIINEINKGIIKEYDNNNFTKYIDDFFTAKNCKFINLAFNFVMNIENCGIKTKLNIPDNYKELLDNLGIRDKSNIV
jgi:hypothetical protein